MALLAKAALKSGALIMPEFCAKSGKDVFAVQESIHSSVLRGTNGLIQNSAFIALWPHDMVDQLK